MRFKSSPISTQIGQRNQIYRRIVIIDNINRCNLQSVIPENFSILFEKLMVVFSSLTESVFGVKADTIKRTIEINIVAHKPR